jgi:beta-glucanase (GH16 family)
MKLAVGGRFLGAPDSTTKFPGEMQVDWVRVYEQLQQRKE